jgi:hypothetical protein
LLVVGIGITVAAATTMHASADRADTLQPPVVSWDDDGGYRYEYHIPTGTEFLYDVNADPRGLVNLIAREGTRAARCRHSLETKLSVQNLEELRAPYAEKIKRLRALGYL